MSTLNQNSHNQMLMMLEDLVNIDSGSYDKEGVNQIGDFLCNLYEEIGFSITRYENKEFGDNIVLRHKEAVNPTVLILTHMDTVFPKGTVKKRPFSKDNNRAFGPGVIDMKASHVLLYFSILELIKQKDDAYKNIEIILNSDEEIGSKVSRPLIERHAKGKRAAFVLEPARADGSLVSARKGTGKYSIEIHGKAAHAGIEPENGRSAIEVLGHKIVKLHALSNLNEGISVNVGTVGGGTSTNTVAECATATIDVRISNQDQAIQIDKKIKEVCLTSEVNGVNTTLQGGINRYPMVRTKETEQLISMIENEGKELGITIKHVSTGGGSDASLVSILGIPTIDGLGPIGGKQHSDEEYLEIDSLFERTQLFIRVLKRMQTEDIL